MSEFPRLPRSVSFEADQASDVETLRRIEHWLDDPESAPEDDYGFTAVVTYYRYLSGRGVGLDAAIDSLRPYAHRLGFALPGDPAVSMAVSTSSS